MFKSLIPLPWHCFSLVKKLRSVSRRAVLFVWVIFRIYAHIPTVCKSFATFFTSPVNQELASRSTDVLTILSELLTSDLVARNVFVSSASFKSLEIFYTFPCIILYLSINKSIHIQFLKQFALPYKLKHVVIQIKSCHYELWLS